MSISPKRIKELKALEQKDIDYSDVPETDAEFWSKAQVVYPEKKQLITIRLDPNVVTWFKEKGPRYQSKINEVLKSYIRTH
jgi:uncharacterized protein (DUF4415 family)